MFWKGKSKAGCQPREVGNAISCPVGEGKTTGSRTSESGIPGKGYGVRDLGAKVDASRIGRPGPDLG